LLHFVGMTMFGLAYRALPSWIGKGEPPVGLVRAHFWLAVAGIIGVCGTIGYEVMKLVQPDFYYIGGKGWPSATCGSESMGCS
jgi:hypothetical protein